MKNIGLIFPKISEAVIERLLLVCALMLIGGVLGFGWYTLQPRQYQDEFSSLMKPLPTPTPAQTLKLNQNHQREGQVIEVDPNAIGKTNPFK